MKQPARSDFDTLVTEANVRVAFKPTNSIYIFYRLTDPNNIASVGPVSFAGVEHAERNTGDYPQAEVQEMAQLIASEFANCFRSPLEEALAAIGAETKIDNVTHIRPVSVRSVSRRLASEVETTLGLIQNLDKADDQSEDSG
jgi:hypothetical protein